MYNHIQPTISSSDMVIQIHFINLISEDIHYYFPGISELIVWMKIVYRIEEQRKRHFNDGRHSQVFSHSHLTQAFTFQHTTQPSHDAMLNMYFKPSYLEWGGQKMVDISSVLRANIIGMHSNEDLLWLKDCWPEPNQW